MLNFPKIPKIALRKFSELSHSLWRSKRAKSTQDSFLLGGSSHVIQPCDGFPVLLRGIFHGLLRVFLEALHLVSYNTFWIEWESDKLEILRLIPPKYIDIFRGKICF